MILNFRVEEEVDASFTYSREGEQSIFLGQQEMMSTDGQWVMEVEIS